MKARPCWIDPKEFKITRQAAGLTVDQVAGLLFVTPRTVRYWEAGRYRIPYPAFKLLRILRGAELPGEAWAGWRVTRGALWSPAGQCFLPGELAYLSLVFRQAWAFRQQQAQQAGRRAQAQRAPAVPLRVASRGS